MMGEADAIITTTEAFQLASVGGASLGHRANRQAHSVTHCADIIHKVGTEPSEFDGPLPSDMLTWFKGVA